MDDFEFHVDDLVTRDGTDVHRVTRADEGYGNITVVCVKAPASGWCKVGEVEDNLAGRYAFVGALIEASAVSGLFSERR